MWRIKTGWNTNHSPCKWHGVSCVDGKVTRLFLDNNHLNGTLPSELSHLSQLQILNFSKNQLGGEIPPQLGELSQLEGLYLYDNQLSGSIPPELGDLSNSSG